MTPPLVFLDTETTGLHPDRRGWEVAMIRTISAPAPGEDSYAEISMFVSDVDLSSADPKALSIGRFHDRHPMHSTIVPATPPTDGVWCLPEAEVARTVERWTCGATIVGAVPSFDTETLAAMLSRHRLTPTWHHRLMCVESMALPQIGWNADGRPMGLAAVAEALDIEHDEQDLHTALGDARIARRIFEHLVATR
ncbi:MAG: hypothetical protein WBF79_13515 [Rhodococcus sp. (in: high G+C Gram-positive bacteria)]